VTSIFDNEGKQVEKKYETVKEDNGGRDQERIPGKIGGNICD
jgi:hypothetical protein